MNRTKPQPVNTKQVRLFLSDAQKRAVTARKNLAIDAEVAYQIAYEAMIKASLALMLSHGQRPRVQLGHHIAIIEFAQKHCPATPQSCLTFSIRMRRKRNTAFYDIVLVSDTEANEAVTTAHKYLQTVSEDIKSRVP